MLLVKEIKDSHVLWTIIGGIVLLFAAFTWMFYSDVITLFGFNEILVSTVAAIYCSHILYNFTDLELLTAAPRSLFTIIFTKYIAFVGCILVLGGIQVLLSLLLFPKAAFVILMSLIPQGLRELRPALCRLVHAGRRARAGGLHPLCDRLCLPCLRYSFKGCPAAWAR